MMIMKHGMNELIYDKNTIGVQVNTMLPADSVWNFNQQILL